MGNQQVIYQINGKQFQCPIELSVSILAGRWKTTIICQLLNGKKRYGELKKNIMGVNHKMLAEQLRELEESGIVLRHVYPVVPPKVEYELTERGEALRPVIEYLIKWGEQFGTPVADEVEPTA
ncbi:helix-turn-helix domain-containing protein [Brevibacillus sp. FSL K6-0770]|jgi:DNA-binding HxlR family transcriptional regulator|uniref:Transcriptional regulator n=1 Tax=Brevibacillus parabrevis TaxID=54914 RepID=A0A4Y3PJ04_BREPA|nr:MULTISPECIES: helix-turn-helix domain-containing protein [Brevibacillus]MBU8715858.1 helix-turn-helix transcriptional regulator [Brevibacillus parabrevis]MED2258123.1 helix-turn-helix domain-containing protein [Brevibacillus parabrevis]RNB95897.1 transcriptional regulator [Brevibacillus parabrevis]GEB33413.1 transcriptional regulator [Brevibacillus parabrevis]HBZ83165.1 MarR family transcriptional regulator [Brevibacillus sp.]